MGIARGWEKRVIRTNITYAKRTVRIFSVSPQSRSLFSASFQTFRLTARAYLNTQKMRTVLQCTKSIAFLTFLLLSPSWVVIARLSSLIKTDMTFREILK